MTKNRTKLLDILIKETLPLNATQIHDKTEGELDLATVYRGLTYLEKNNHITSFVFDCHSRGVERYFTPVKEEHEHFMHCEVCHRFISIPLCPLKDSFSKIEKEYGFIVDEHYLTIRGLCRECSKKENI
jgi:Fur family ferric uptake transcriptional regulator